MKPRIVILTEGFTFPVEAKTASCMIRYRGEEVVALLDSTQAGRSSRELLQVGDVPIVASLDEVEADTLLIGVANPGGKITGPWRALILDAIGRGMNVVSGMHQFLNDDPQFAQAAREHNVTLTDVRNRKIWDVAVYPPVRPENLRIHTVGHDCSIGKMVTSVEITRGLQARGVDAKFAATGQTGIMVEGDGYPVDCMVADFVSGAAERLIMENQDRDVVVIEGQGSLYHPSYSGVTLGLLHGCRPHGLILCYEVGRRHVLHLEHVAIPPLNEVRRQYESIASLHAPCQVIGISMNSRNCTPEAAAAERERVSAEFGLPVCDVFRDGADQLVDAVLALREHRIKGEPIAKDATG